MSWGFLKVIGLPVFGLLVRFGWDALEVIGCMVERDDREARKRKRNGIGLI